MRLAASTPARCFALKVGINLEASLPLPTPATALLALIGLSATLPA